jgi:Holliday junction resolvase RusA-like endonuclease
MAKQQKLRLTGGILIVQFEFGMAKSWSDKKKKEHLGKPHLFRPDTDNLVKGFMDAIEKEDSHVHTVIARKIFCETDRDKICAIIPNENNQNQVDSILQQFITDGLASKK